jgi:hypothetical protein
MALVGVALLGCSSSGGRTIMTSMCRPLVVDGGAFTLDQAPEALCVRGLPGAIRWNGSCAGSIVVVQSTGADCAGYWLFNEATGALQATGTACNVSTPFCTGVIPGFVFPQECFGGAFPTGVTQLCPANQSDGGTDATGADSKGGTSDADPRACTGPLAADAGVTSLDDLPIAALCMNAIPGVQRWDDQCQGSIVVAKGHNADCVSYWLFDPTTKQLQATADGCVAGPRCTGSVPGFVFSSQCFDGNLYSPRTELCAASHPDGSADLGDGSSADSPIDAGGSH